MSQIDALAFAGAATLSLMLVNRSLRRFHLSFEAKAWMALAWLLIIVAAMLVAQALRL